MKAAVLREIGALPVYTDYADPKAENEGQVVVSVKASSIKQLDLLRAAGKHYTHYPSLPVVMGMDGVAVLNNGQRVYAMGITGMMAEKAIIEKAKWIAIPDGLSDAMAAALPNTLIGSDIALRNKGNIKEGDIVFVNGATGATGMMAVQMAKYHKASVVFATGRNPEALENLKKMGADITISLHQPEHDIVHDIKKAYTEHPFDIVIDYLWGKPTEYLLESLSKLPTLKKTKIVTVGEMAGKVISLPSAILRSKNISIIGSGFGSVTPQVIADYMQHTLPEIFKYAAAGNISLDMDRHRLEDVAKAWNLNKTVVIEI